MNEDMLAGLFAKTGDVVEQAQADQDAREADLCKSDYVGVADERQTLRLTLVDVLGPFPGDWGDRFGYVFHAGDPGETCDTVIWWTASKPPSEVGETADYDCTVTGHELYQNKKQTKVARIKRVNAKIKAAKARRKKAEENPQEDE